MDIQSKIDEWKKQAKNLTFNGLVVQRPIFLAFIITRYDAALSIWFEPVIVTFYSLLLERLGFFPIVFSGEVTRRQVDDAVRTFVRAIRKVRKEENTGSSKLERTLGGLLFFGHGYQEERGVAASDSSPEDDFAADTVLTPGDIAQYLMFLKTCFNDLIFILDCCGSGGTLGDIRESLKTMKLQNITVTQQQGRIEPTFPIQSWYTDSIVGIASCAATQFAESNVAGGTPLLTSLILCLAKYADKTYMSIFDLFYRASRMVPKFFWVDKKSKNHKNLTYHQLAIPMNLLNDTRAGDVLLPVSKTQIEGILKEYANLGGQELISYVKDRNLTPKAWKNDSVLSKLLQCISFNPFQIHPSMLLGSSQIHISKDVKEAAEKEAEEGVDSSIRLIAQLQLKEGKEALANEAKVNASLEKGAEERMEKYSEQSMEIGEGNDKEEMDRLIDKEIGEIVEFYAAPEEPSYAEFIDFMQMVQCYEAEHERPPKYSENTTFQTTIALVNVQTVKQGENGEKKAVPKTQQGKKYLLMLDQASEQLKKIFKTEITPWFPWLQWVWDRKDSIAMEVVSSFLSQRYSNVKDITVWKPYIQMLWEHFIGVLGIWNKALLKFEFYQFEHGFSSVFYLKFMKVLGDTYAPAERIKPTKPTTEEARTSKEQLQFLQEYAHVKKPYWAKYLRV